MLWRRTAQASRLRGVSSAGWRIAAGAALACGVFACGVHVGRDADWGGVARSKSALDAAASHVARARRLLAAASGQSAAASPAAANADAPDRRETAVDFALRLAAHAQTSGLRVRQLDRLGGESVGSRRDGGAYTLALSAEGDFSAFLHFFAGLALLSPLVVPVTSSAKRDGETTVLETRLDVWPGLPGRVGRLWANAPDAPRVDPFAVMPMFAAGEAEGGARLVGVLSDRRSGLALFERGSAAWSVAAGQAVGGDRLARIDAGGVTLVTHDGGQRAMRIGGGAK
ncbi:hypothetical protein [Burkholderia sp. TSV86]|uniref:hypothetical protein n=1 Tax=Burkholderia sp. TSV86 TaxID=1385594 RepID=UPI000754253F|nr:hypothetical protein [Burkholderia sp. TSV86]KVE36064.1 hypothetical protein WS68_05175 [Burkholderia sp. TSV86]